MALFKIAMRDKESLDTLVEKTLNRLHHTDHDYVLVELMEKRFKLFIIDRIIHPRASTLVVEHHNRLLQRRGSPRLHIPYARPITLIF